MAQEVFTEDQCGSMTVTEKIHAMKRINKESLDVSKGVALALTEGLPKGKEEEAAFEQAGIPPDEWLTIRMTNITLLEKAHNLLGVSF